MLVNEVLMSPTKVLQNDFKQVCPFNFLPFHIRHQWDKNETNYQLKIKISTLITFVFFEGNRLLRISLLAYLL